MQWDQIELKWAEMTNRVRSGYPATTRPATTRREASDLAPVRTDAASILSQSTSKSAEPDKVTRS